MDEEETDREAPDRAPCLSRVSGKRRRRRRRGGSDQSPCCPGKRGRRRRLRARPRFRRYRAMTGASTVGPSASMPSSASAACAATRRARRKTRSPATLITSAPGSSATSMLEGEDKPHIDSQADPVNIAAAGSEGNISIRQSLQGREGGKGVLRAQAVQPLHASGLRASVPDRRDIQDRGRRGRDRPYLLHRLPVLRPGLPIRRAVLQC